MRSSCFVLANLTSCSLLIKDLETVQESDYGNPPRNKLSSNGLAQPYAMFAIARYWHDLDFKLMIRNIHSQNYLVYPSSLCDHPSSIFKSIITKLRELRLTQPCTSPKQEQKTYEETAGTHFYLMEFFGSSGLHLLLSSLMNHISNVP